jgi:hypothetical protein
MTRKIADAVIIKYSFLCNLIHVKIIVKHQSQKSPKHCGDVQIKKRAFLKFIRDKNCAI